MKQIKQLSVIFLFISISYSGYSQFSVSYYNSSLSKIGVGYNISNRVWTEMRLYSNTNIDNITPELVFCYNFINKEKHNVYVGLGGNINYFNGFVLPLGVQFKPIEKLDRFSIHIEFQPTLDIENDLILQSSWGLRYKFGNKNKNNEY